MNVSNSAIAAYYVGNTALALDRNTVQHEGQRRLRAVQPPPEQVLEGELLNNRPKTEQRREQEAPTLEREDDGFNQQQRGQPSLAPTQDGGTFVERQLQQYETTARLDGFIERGPLPLIDVYV